MTEPNESLAAVDLGSNSFPMIVARAPQGQIHVIDRMREMVRLAAGLNAKRKLSRDSRARAIDCLERFGQRLRDLPEQNVRAVGTNTLRTAKNSDAFIARAEEALGHRIEIIGGREEARLIYLGVANSVPQDDNQFLVMDIGGGSTEFIIGRRTTPLATESLFMGCVSLSKACFRDGRLNTRNFRDAEVAALRELDPIRTPFLRMGWSRAIGSSGTVRAVRDAIVASGRTDGVITLDGTTELIEQMKACGRIDRLDLPGINAERAPVIAGGLVIVHAALKALQIDSMEVSDGALREGLLFDMLGRISHEDAREKTIIDLASRYHIDLEQADRVESAALYLLGHVRRAWRLNNPYWADVLRWAARLHEVGLDIAHSQYHRHGAYVIEYSDLPGFSRQDQAMLAALIRVHRRKFRESAFADFSAKQQLRLRRLAVILRLAVLLHRARSDDSAPDFGVSVDASTLCLSVPDDWLERHPLTRADLRQENAYLKGTEFRLRQD